MKIIKLIILIIILENILTPLTGNKIDLLKLEAYKKMSEKEKYDLINMLITKYNECYLEYKKIIMEIEKKEKMIEKLKKRNNLISFYTGYNLNMELESSIVVGMGYNRIFFNIFSLNTGFGIIYNFNNLSRTSFNINIGIGFLF